MSRIDNADDFLLKFRRVRADYNNIFSRQLQKLRESLAGAPQQDVDREDLNLEAHARVYTVNALLEALNWRMDVQAHEMGPNLVPEAALKSLERGSRRFLDYLGIERDTSVPLLVLESKRPSAELPRIRDVDRDAVHSVTNYSVVVSAGLRGAALALDWNEWLGTLRDYVQSVHTQAGMVPPRVAITNGDWLIVFLDPADAFLADGTIDAAKIVVFAGSVSRHPDVGQAVQSEIESRYTEVFEHLEYHRVLGKTDDVELGALTFHVEGKNVDQMMHGLRLQYDSMQTVYAISPSIHVSPVLLIRSCFGAWVTLKSGQEFMIPHDQEQLAAHLASVGTAAQGLLAQANDRLGTIVPATDLANHFGDATSFDGLKAFRDVSPDTYVVATGNNTHYLLAEPSVPVCPFHDVNASVAQGVGPDVPIYARSVDPRAFFKSGEAHHCAHRQVHVAKASAITAANQELCGLRSGGVGQAFCEIWKVDQYLCCRACAFQSACTKAAAFHLPCHLPD